MTICIIYMRQNVYQTAPAPEIRPSGKARTIKYTKYIIPSSVCVLYVLLSPSTRQSAPQVRAPKTVPPHTWMRVNMYYY